MGVGVFVGVEVLVGVAVFVGVLVGVDVFVGVLVGVEVGDSVGVGVKSPWQSIQFSHGPLNTVTTVAKLVGSNGYRVQQPILVEPANNS